MVSSNKLENTDTSWKDLVDRQAKHGTLWTDPGRDSSGGTLVKEFRGGCIDSDKVSNLKLEELRLRLETRAGAT